MVSRKEYEFWRLTIVLLLNSLVTLGLSLYFLISNIWISNPTFSGVCENDISSKKMPSSQQAKYYKDFALYSNIAF